MTENQEPSLPPSNWDLASEVVKNWWAFENTAFEPAALCSWAEKKWAGLENWSMEMLFDELWRIAERRYGREVKRGEVLRLLRIKDPEPVAIRKERLEKATGDVEAGLRLNVPGAIERALAMVTERILFHSKSPQDDDMLLSLCNRLTLLRGRLANQREQKKKNDEEAWQRRRINGRAAALDWEVRKKPRNENEERIYQERLEKSKR